MSDHAWGLVIIGKLTDDQAKALAATDTPSRFEQVHELLDASEPVAVRGPICTECRVHWRDVYAQPDKPWPCKGTRPAPLGGPLVPPDTRTTRQQRRAAQRAAVKAER